MSNKKETNQADAPGAEELKALVADKQAKIDDLQKEITSLKAVAEGHYKEVERLNAKLSEPNVELAEAEKVIEDLKKKVAEYEAAPAVDGKGRKVHKLKGTKKQYRLIFPTKLGEVLVNDEALAADDSLLKQLVEMESGAIEEV